MLWWIMGAGALGSGARYLVGLWAFERFGAGFPYGTLIVNVIGSFALGAVVARRRGVGLESRAARRGCRRPPGRLHDVFQLQPGNARHAEPRLGWRCRAEHRDHAGGVPGRRMSRSRRRAPTCGIVPRMRILAAMIAAAALLSAAPPVTVRAQALAGARLAPGGNGAARPATSWCRRPAWPTVARRRVRRCCGAVRSAPAIRRSSSTRAGSTRCIAPATAAPSRGRGRPKRPWWPWTPRRGKTLWEHKYPSRREDFSFGAGPHSTPLIVGDRLFTIGTNKQLFAFDKKTGRVLWSHDLIKEFNSPELLIRPVVKTGYGCSPIAYRDTIICSVGGPGQSVMAFRQSDGAVVVEERRLSDVRGAADPDRDGRPPAAGDLRRRHRERPGSGQRRVLWSHPTIPATISIARRRCSGPTTSCSCRRPTGPAAARSS